MGWTARKSDLCRLVVGGCGCGCGDVTGSAGTTEGTEGTGADVSLSLLSPLGMLHGSRWRN